MARSRTSLVLRLVGALLAGLCALATLPFLVLLSPSARQNLVQRALTSLENATGYDVRIERVDRIDPWGIELRGVMVRDPAGDLSLDVGSVSARLSPSSLLGGGLTIRSLQVSEVHGHVRRPPPSTAPGENDATSSDSGTFPIRVETMQLRQLAVEVRGLEPLAGVRVHELAVAGEWSDHPWLYVARADLSVAGREGLLLQLVTRKSEWDATRGGLVHLTGTMADAPLELTASMQPNPDGPWPKATIQLRVAALAPKAWAALGLASAQVREPVSLDAKVDSDGSQVRADLRVSAGGTRAHLHGEGAAEWATAVLDVTSPDLSRLSDVLPEMELAGRVHGRAAPLAAPMEIALSWEDLSVQGTQIPDGQLAAALDLPRIRLHQLTLDPLGDSLQVEGDWDTDAGEGNIDVALNDLNLSALPFTTTVPLRGQANGRVQMSLARSGDLTGSGALQLERLFVEGARVSHAALDLQVRGTLAHPGAAFELSASGLDLSGTRLQRLTVEGELGRDRAHANVVARAPEGWVLAEIEAQQQGSDAIDVITAGHASALGVPFSFALQGQHSLRHKNTEAALQLNSGGDRVTVQALVSDGGVGRAQLNLFVPNLERWAGRLALQSLHGSVTAQVMAEGDLARPEVSVQLEAANVHGLSSPPIHARLDAHGSLLLGEAQLRARVWNDRKDANALLDLAVHVPRGRGDELDFDATTQEAKLSGHVPLALLTSYADPKFQGITGFVEVEASAAGPVSDPRVDALLSAQMSLVAQPELKPESLRVAVHTSASDASLLVDAHDLQGELLMVTAKVRWPEPTMRASLVKLSADSVPPFELRARINERRLDTMQGVLAFLTGAYKVELPVLLGGQLTLTGNGQELDGSARAKLRVYGDKLDPRCTLGADSLLELAIDLKQNDIEAHAIASTNGGGRVESSVHTRLLLGKEALPGKVLKDVVLAAKGEAIALRSLPGFCGLDAGVLAFELRANGFGEQPLRSRLDVRLDGLLVQGGPPASLELTATATPTALRADGKLLSGSKRAGQLSAHVPMITAHGSSLPSLAWDAPLTARLDFSALPVGPFMALYAGLGRPRGTITGMARASGTLRSPKPEAVMDLKDVSFSVASIAQPFRDIDGRVSLRGRTVRIQALTARDRDGKIRFDGEASMKADGSGEGELRVKADKFPLRRQGQVVAELTTQLRARAQVDTRHSVRTDLDVDGGRLWLSGRRGRNVQSLQAHDDVRLADVPDQEAEPSPVKTSMPLSLGSLVVKTKKTLWVMHRDFTVQVGLDVSIKREETLVMRGAATIVRGNLDLLGKSFRIEKGAINFTGDFPPDPDIDMHAVYEVPTGEDLNVDVTGRASAPVLAFSGAAESAAEAVAVLSGGGRAGAQSEAQTDARNFAASLTAGLLSVTIREEFGDWVPIVAIENDESGAPARGRAGFDASKLIPPFLQGIARGAYVEGIVGTSNQTGGSVGLGARLEIALPHDFVTSAGYGPGPTWGTDLMWEP